MPVKKVVVDYQIKGQQDIKKAGKGFDDINDKAKKSTKSIGGFNNILAKTAGIIGGIALADKLIDIGKQAIRVTAEFQKMSAVLKTSLGSQSEADKAFQRIRKFAADTPFQVREITDSFVRLANQGFVPTNNELKNLGDLAASTGKDFTQLAEAIIDAQVGEFERLKEFGIRAEKQGDQVKFTFKGVEEQVDFTSDAIQEYILGLGEVEGVSGSMAEISETLAGKISNLEDAVDNALFTLGTKMAPAIGGVLGLLTELIAGTEKASDATKEQQSEINALVGAITDQNGTEETRAALIGELNEKYPKFLGNLEAEKVTNEELTNRLKDVNEQLERKFLLQIQEEELEQLGRALAEAKKEELKILKELNDEETQRDAVLTGVVGTSGTAEQKTRALNASLRVNREEQESINNKIKENKEFYEQLLPVLEDVTEAVTNLSGEFEALSDFTFETIPEMHSKASEIMIETSDQARELANEQRELMNEDLKEWNKKELEAIRMKASKRRFIMQETFSIANSLSKQRTNNELRNIQARFEAGKITDKKALQLKQQALRKEADNQRLLSLFQIVTQGAAAVIKAFAQLGPAAGAIAATALGVTIATQRGKVKDATLGFAKGTKKAPGGFARVGEIGEELMFVPEGAKVLPNNRVREYSNVIDSMFDGRFQDDFMEKDKAEKLIQSIIFNKHSFNDKNLIKAISKSSKMSANKIVRAIKDTDEREFIKSRSWNG